VELRRTSQTTETPSPTRQQRCVRPLGSPENASVAAFGPTPTRQAASELPFGAPRVTLVATEDRYSVVEVGGDIDILVRAELAGVLIRACDSGTPALIVDLSAVTLFSAAAFSCLQQVADLLAARGGRLHIACPPGSVPCRILRLFDPDGRWPRHTDAAAAVAAVTGGI
jgi:anti-anti-sigma regulatory factor